MPTKLINSFSFPPATTSSVPIYDFAIPHTELAEKTMDIYYFCGGCIHSFGKTGNNENCPFCNSDTEVNSDAENIENIMKQVDSNDTGAMHSMGNCYYSGLLGLQQDETKAIELWIRAAEFGCSKVHNDLGMHYYYHGENWKKAKFHLEAAAMAGHEGARSNIGHLEFLQFNNTDRAIKHWIIAASSGSYLAMNAMRSCFEL